VTRFEGRLEIDRTTIVVRHPGAPAAAEATAHDVGPAALDHAEFSMRETTGPLSSGLRAGA
jgi:hypothetical protein